MSRSSAPERIALKLARLIAGPERHKWLDAIETELDHLSAQRRLDWALGAVVAATKARAPDAALAMALLIALPCLAAVATGPAFETAKPIVRAIGASIHLALPVAQLLPLAVGTVLGAAHRWRHPLVAGALAFAFHQAGTSLYHGIWQERGFALWAIDLRPLGIGSEPTVFGLLVLWCLGILLGARLREGPGGRRPSPR